jgi:glucan phosphoethanolaminetransferase (alkaline phosphatase superfamily)
MHILPKTKREWVELSLIPFMVYVLVIPIWLRVWRVLAETSTSYSFLHGDRISRAIWHDERFIFGRWYFLCFAVFCIAGIIQFYFRWRRAALVSFIFAAVTIEILFLYLLPLSESK